MPRTSERGIAHLIILLIVLVGIVIGVYLSLHPTFFLPKATQPNLAESTKYGVNAGGVAQSDPKLNEALSLASSAGIGWIRTGGCSWGDVLSKDPGLSSPTPTSPWPADIYHFSGCDSFINNIVNNNHLSLLTNFFYSTPWCTASPKEGELNILTNKPIEGAEVVKAEPCDYNKFYDFVYKLVARYGSTAHPELGSDYGKGWIKYFEIGNEPDGSSGMLYYTFGSPSATVAPSDTERKVNISSHYAHIVQVAHDAIKAADPSSQVVLGGLIQTVIGGSDQQSTHPDDNLLDQILNNPPYNSAPYDNPYPAANNFDIMNFHCYCPTSTASTKLTQIYDSLKQAGVANKPIWVTEVGSGTIAGQTVSSFPCTGQPDSSECQQSQANYLKEILPYFLNGTTASDGTKVSADKVFWYSLLDSPKDDSSFCSYGLTWYGSTDFQCGAPSNPSSLPNLVSKLAYATYQSLILGISPPPTPSPKPSLTPTPAPNNQTSFSLQPNVGTYALANQLPVSLLARADQYNSNLFVAKMHFSTSTLQVSSISFNGTFIRQQIEKSFDNVAGTISIIGGFANPGFKTSGAPALMATINFTPKTTGSGSISFDPSSSIFRNSDNVNILNLSLTTGGNYTFSSGVQPTSTPTPTPSPSSLPRSTPTPTPTSASSLFSTSTPTPTPTQFNFFQGGDQTSTSTPTPTDASFIVNNFTPTPTPTTSDNFFIPPTPTPTSTANFLAPTSTPTSVKVSLKPSSSPKAPVSLSPFVFKPLQTPAPLVRPTPTPKPQLNPIQEILVGIESFFSSILNIFTSPFK
ncbi:hypothetical protein HY025_06040 [Candidatus Daviesbacteria bacterium]|nr:hypothetical protein [Candidatus Daviesbacteria bacterium]